MATVTFFSPAAMNNLDFSPSSSRLADDDVYYVEVRSITGPNSLWTFYGDGFTPLNIAGGFSGTLTGLAIDNTDTGFAPNLIISGLNYALSETSVTSVLPELLPLLLSGNDVLRGSAGSDIIMGFGGNDLFIASTGSDGYDGGGDRDTVSYTGASAGLFAGLEDAGFNTGLAAGDSYISIENLIGTPFNDVLYGTGAANKFSAGAGNDLMVGKGGADTLEGGAGSDTVSYDASLLGIRADLLTPATNTGHAAGDRYVSIENLDGSSFNDMLYGNNSANVLQGNTYHAPSNIDQDQLFGRGGNDTLRGWDGNDILEGGTGRDILTGGLGADKFVFKAGDTGKTSSTRDVITDFTHRNSSTLALADSLDLSAIDASTAASGEQGFKFIAASAFSGTAGQLRFKLENNTGTANDRTIVEGDINGDRIADFQIQLTGLKTLLTADFVL